MRSEQEIREQIEFIDAKIAEEAEKAGIAISFDEDDDSDEESIMKATAYWRTTKKALEYVLGENPAPVTGRPYISPRRVDLWKGFRGLFDRAWDEHKRRVDAQYGLDGTFK